MTQLQALVRPFPRRYIHQNPSGGGSYVEHSTVVQRLLHVLGPFNFELVEIVRGHVDAIAPNPNAESKRGKEGRPALENVVVGAVCRLRVSIDGWDTTVEEIGDTEQPHNWPHDGARLKDAMSDAIKRCAMRLGVGLHLWCDDEFYLPAALAQKTEAGESGIREDLAEGDMGSGESTGVSSSVVADGASSPASPTESDAA